MGDPVTTHANAQGLRHFKCPRCGASSPPATTAKAARFALKGAGWTRASVAGEEYICPACRVPRQTRTEPVKWVRHLRSPTNPRFSLCGRHHVDLTDDMAEMNCGLCQRSLARVAASPSDKENHMSDQSQSEQQPDQGGDSGADAGTTEVNTSGDVQVNQGNEQQAPGEPESTE